MGDGLLLQKILALSSWHIHQPLGDSSTPNVAAIKTTIVNLEHCMIMVPSQAEPEVYMLSKFCMSITVTLGDIRGSRR